MSSGLEEAGSIPSRADEHVGHARDREPSASTCASSSGGPRSAEHTPRRAERVLEPLEKESLCDRIEQLFIGDDEDNEVLVEALSSILENMASLSDHPGHQKTCFHSRAAPPISVRDYLKRIAKHFHCSSTCLVLSLMYIDRAMKLLEGFQVDAWNIHRLLLTSVMIAAKFHDDVYYSNTHYARVGGVKVKELNRLETHFLAMMQWRFNASREEYDVYCGQLNMVVQGRLPQVPPRPETP